MSIQTPFCKNSLFGSNHTTSSRAASQKKKLPSLNAEKQLWRRYCSRDKKISSSSKVLDDQQFLTVNKMKNSRNSTNEKFNTCLVEQSAETPLGQEQVPYPFLQAFIDRNNGTRFTKRVVFDHSHFDNLLTQICDQREERKYEEAYSSAKLKYDEQEELERQRVRIAQEVEHEKADKEMKRSAFVEANKLLKYEKELREHYENEDRINERLNYFPFTHGDTIEKQREDLTELQKADLLATLRENESKKLEEYKARQTRQSKLNQEANAMMLQTDGQGQFGSNQGETGEGGPHIEFLKNHCIQKSIRYQPHVVKDDDGGAVTHRHKVAMDLALSRHLDQLKKFKDAKDQQLKDHYEQIDVENKKANEEAYESEAKRAELEKTLLVQMEHNAERRAGIFVDRKAFKNTNGGPEVPTNTAILQEEYDRRRNRDQREVVKGQAIVEMTHAHVKKQVMDEQDRFDAEQERARYEKQNAEILAAKKASNKHFASVWTQQKNAKKADEAMNNYI